MPSLPHPDHLFHLLSTDAFHSVAQFHRYSLFHDYHISNNYSNCIAFYLDLSLRFMLTIYSQFLGPQPRPPPHQACQEASLSTLPTPSISSHSKPKATIPPSSTMSPSPNPLSHVDHQDLQTALDNTQEIPVTLVRALELNPLQNFIDRMKHIGDVIGVSITKYGNFHLQILTSLIAIDAEL